MDPSAELIRSRGNPLIRRLRSLKERGADEDVVLLEGVKLAEEALASGIEILEVAASPRVERHQRGRGLVEALRTRAVVRRVEEHVLDSLTEMETHQGILALARRPVFDEERIFRDPALVLVAVGVQDPGNLGGLLRTAEAAGATGALLTAGTADPFSWKSLRGSMGSAFRLPHRRGVQVDDLPARLSARSVKAAAAVVGAPVRYDQADWRGPVAFLFGNEGAGLPDELLLKAKVKVSIPMAGAAESLNVGVAAGILLFEAARQRRHAR
jgi:TrmH family RNA methyltransferase